MLNQPGQSLRTSTGIVVLSGYLALMCVVGYSPLLIFIPIVALILTPRGERMHAAKPGYQVASRALTIAYFCFLPLTVILMGAIPALQALIMYIQCHLLLHQKTERSYLYLYMMSFFLVLAACVQSPEPYIAFVLLMQVLGTAWALSALRLVAEPQTVRPHAEPEIERMGAKRSAATKTEQRANVPIVVTVAFASIAIVLLTSLFFVATPRVEAGFLGRDVQMVRMTGFAQTVDLQGGAYVQEDPTPVMQVEFPDEANGMFPPDLMYWRVTTLPGYARSSWSRKGLDRHYMEGVDSFFATNTQDFREAMSNPTEVARNATDAGARVVTQRIYSDRLPDEGLPCLDLPLKAELEGRREGKQIAWDGRQDITIRLTRSSSNQLDYTIWSEILRPDPAMLRATPMVYESLTPADLAMLTEHDLLEETQELTASITADFDNPYDKAVAVLEFLSGQGFEYTLNLPALPQENAIDAFINTVRLGHCEFFASAMALMLRSQGIPTRVVSGYRGGEWSEGAEAYIVRQSMAHLWVEVYFEGYGWARFDPAPPSTATAVQGVAALLQRLNDLQLRARLFWFREVISFDRGLQLERLRALPGGIFRSLGFAPSLEELENPGAARNNNRFVSYLAFAAMLIGVVVGGYYWFRRPRELFPLTPDQRRAVKLFSALNDRLARNGIPLSGLSAEEIENAVQARGWSEFGDVQEILHTYNSVRFGRQPLEPSRLGALVRKLRTLHPKPHRG